MGIDKDSFVVVPVDKAVYIVDENGEFLFATSAKHVIEGLSQHETMCDYLGKE